jgi:hypothetical protein
MPDPRIGEPRHSTPDVETMRSDGTTSVTVTLKRCCNGCGSVLGDVDNRDVTKDGHLTDVRAECARCAACAPPFSGGRGRSRSSSDRVHVRR